MMYGYGASWGSMYGLGAVFMVLVWALVILGVVALFHWLAQDKRGRSSDTALDILKERYARGELSSQEYNERKKILES